ncbi:MAG: hypothetical protein KC657_09040 [Myxococcales bacterium]|nr:hypothetical protein [Myxococcales bacterium]
MRGWWALWPLATAGCSLLVSTEGLSDGGADAAPSGDASAGVDGAPADAGLAADTSIPVDASPACAPRGDRCEGTTCCESTDYCGGVLKVCKRCVTEGFPCKGPEECCTGSCSFGFCLTM